MQVYLSTAYFPPVYYFSKICHSSLVYIESDENFQKQTYRNRCIILGANGPLSLSIPIQHTSEPKINIRDVKISYHTPWQKIHLRAIESAYRNSPFYEYYIHDFLPFFNKKFDFLLDYNQKILKTCLELADLKVNIELTNAFTKEHGNDFRFSISPKKEYPDIQFPEYNQVFIEKFGFVSNLSILDLLFNEGPESRSLLKAIT
ncbi:MAG: WbqC family protein [Bacteroidetes bacterium]|nr:WbqC family protein [Bacteroidales bacterium]NJO69747.1 WbqC family protein [Bacteroidota bacterium]